MILDYTTYVKIKFVGSLFLMIACLVTEGWWRVYFWVIIVVWNLPDLIEAYIEIHRNNRETNQRVKVCPNCGSGDILNYWCLKCGFDLA